MTMSLFETRAMLDLLRDLFPPRTFLRDTFFPLVKTSNATTIEFDVFKGKRRLAPFVNPRHEGKPVERLGYKNRTFKPPYIKPFMELNTELLLNRDMGKTIYHGNSSPALRVAEQLGYDLLELIDMITRREEWMASQILHTGKVAIVGEGVDEEIDFLMDAAHHFDRHTVAANRWTNANSKPLKDLSDLVRLISKTSGKVPRVAVFGHDMYEAFLEHEGVQKLFDLRRIDLGEIKPEELEEGVTYVGRLRKPMLDIYLYDEFYNADGTGTVTPMVDPKMVLVGSTKTKNCKFYGGILDLEYGGIAEERYFPKSWIKDNPSMRFLMVQSAPLMAMREPDAFGTIKGIE